MIKSHGDSAAKGFHTDLLGQIDLQEKLEGTKLLAKGCTITILHSTDADEFEVVSK